MSKRRGRPRKAGKRMASGKLSQTAADRAGRGLGDVRSVALSQPHRAWLGETRRLDQRAESEIGRLLLTEKVTEVECWAAERWRNIIREFHVVLATPMTTMSALGQMVTSGAGQEEESGKSEVMETDEERLGRVLAQHGAAMARLRRCGDASAVFSEMERVVIHDQPTTDIKTLKRGLQELAKLWRMREPDDDHADRICGQRDERPTWNHDVKEVAITYR